MPLRIRRVTGGYGLVIGLLVWSGWPGMATGATPARSPRSRAT